MKTLLTLTAILEAGAGVAFLCFPSLLVELLLGSTLDSPAARTLGRVTGTALLALGVACWLARQDGQSRAARGVVAAMALYNLGAVVILGFAGTRANTIGVAFWPAVALHAAMSAWCIAQMIDKTSLTPRSSIRHT